MKDDIYELDELIKALENIKNNGDGALSFPKALYCLALEIKKLNRHFIAHEDAMIRTILNNSAMLDMDRIPNLEPKDEI